MARPKLVRGSYENKPLSTIEKAKKNAPPEKLESEKQKKLRGEGDDIFEPPQDTGGAAPGGDPAARGQVPPPPGDSKGRGRQIPGLQTDPKARGSGSAGATRNNTAEYW